MIRCSELVYWSSKWIVDAIKATLVAVNMDPDAVQVSLSHDSQPCVILILVACGFLVGLLLPRGRGHHHQAPSHQAYYLSVIHTPIMTMSSVLIPFIEPQSSEVRLLGKK